MSDLVVTVPKRLWLDWIMEGDAAGEQPEGEEWGFYLGGLRPDIKPGERLYIVAWGLVRGYAPVTRVEQTGRGWCICREAGAVACTVYDGILSGNPHPLNVPGFRGWQHVWWPREAERHFPEWMTEGVNMAAFTRLTRADFGRWLAERRTA
jgi:hypothetical protein